MDQQKELLFSCSIQIARTEFPWSFFQGIHISSTPIQFLSTIKLPENLRLLMHLAHFISQRQIMSTCFCHPGRVSTWACPTGGIWDGWKENSHLLEEFVLELSLSCVSLPQQKDKNEAKRPWNITETNLPQPHHQKNHVPHLFFHNSTSSANTPGKISGNKTSILHYFLCLWLFCMTVLMQQGTSHGDWIQAAASWVETEQFYCCWGKAEVTGLSKNTYRHLKVLTHRQASHHVRWWKSHWGLTPAL